MRSLILLTFIFQCGCAGDLDPVVVSDVKRFSIENLTYKFEALPEPNRYKVIFNWPIKTDSFTLRSPVSKSFDATPIDVGFSEVLTGGEEYSYHIINKLGERVSEIKIKPPRDIVLEGKITYDGDKLLRAERIFIKSDAIVTTLRSNIILHATEIVSESGTIQNYPTGFMECQRHGQSYNGGNITIKAERARGALTIINQGAKGCHPAAKGGNGGEVKVNIAQGAAFDVDVKLLRATGGPWVPHGQTPIDEYGDVGTACVSLIKEDGNGCL